MLTYRGEDQEMAQVRFRGYDSFDGESPGT